MSGWEIKTLGDVLEVLRNGVSRKQNKNGKGDKISRIESIAHGVFDDSRVGFSALTDEEKRKFRLKCGDILFSHINSVPHVGKTAIIQNDGKIYHGMNLLLMRPTSEVHCTYLQLFLTWVFERGVWARECKQSVNQASVNQQDVKRISITFPKLLAEQKRIVSILDEAFSAIAKAKENAEKNLLAARELFESYLNRVFTQQGPGWQEMKLSELGTTQTGSTPKKANIEDYGDHIPFVKPANFRPDGSLGLGNDGLSEAGIQKARLIPTNSTLMVCIGATIGKSGFNDLPIATNQQINAFLPGKRIHHKFAYYAFITQSFQRAVNHGSGQATLPIINKSKWSAIRISLPEVDEQVKIVGTLDELRANQRRLETIYTQKLANLDELKQSLLQKAFTGQLTAATSELEATV